jgi:hypothetical protein
MYIIRSLYLGLDSGLQFYSYSRQHVTHIPLYIAAPGRTQSDGGLACRRSIHGETRQAA